MFGARGVRKSLSNLTALIRMSRRNHVQNPTPNQMSDKRTAMYTSQDIPDQFQIMFD